MCVGHIYSFMKQFLSKYQCGLDIGTVHNIVGKP